MPNEKLNQRKTNIKSNIGVFLFITYIFIYGLIDTTISLSNYFFSIFLPLIMIVFFVLGTIINFKKVFHHGYLFFLPIGILFLNILNGHEKAAGYLFYYFLGLFFILYIKSHSASIRVGIKSILAFSVLYAVTIIFSFLNPDFFQNNILKYYSPNIQVIMDDYLSQGFYSGIVPFLATASVYMVIGIAVLIYDSSESLLNVRKPFKKLLIGLLFFSLLLTGKRAMVIFSLLSFIFVYLIETKGIKKIKRYFLIMFSLIFFLLYIFVMGSLTTGNDALSRTVQSVYAVITSSDSIDVLSGRGILVKNALLIFHENPMIGIGWWRFADISVSLFGRYTTPHNIYAQLLSETGIIGFSAFVFPIFFCFYSSVRFFKGIKVKYEKSYFLSIMKISIFYQMFFILYGFTGNPLYDYEFLLLYFFAVGSYGATLYSIKKNL